jgi:hypothetical protein
MRQRSWLRHYATNRKVAASSPDAVEFLIYLILPAALWPWIDTASNRIEYQESPGRGGGGDGLPALKTDNFTAICEPDCLENVGA